MFVQALFAQLFTSLCDWMYASSPSQESGVACAILHLLFVCLFWACNWKDTWVTLTITCEPTVSEMSRWGQESGYARWRHLGHRWHQSSGKNELCVQVTRMCIFNSICQVMHSPIPIKQVFNTCHYYKPASCSKHLASKFSRKLSAKIDDRNWLKLAWPNLVSLQMLGQRWLTCNYCLSASKSFAGTEVSNTITNTTYFLLNRSASFLQLADARASNLNSVLKVNMWASFYSDRLLRMTKLFPSGLGKSTKPSKQAVLEMRGWSLPVLFYQLDSFQV